MTAPAPTHGAAAQERLGPPHTFVCYARADSSFVLPLTTYLRARGIPIWMDTDITPGADWDNTVDEQLRTCSSFLFVMSPAATASAEVRGELRTALNHAKPIIPVLYQSCVIPRQLLNVQYLDFSSAADVDALRHDLAVVLESTNRDLAPRESRPRLDGRDLRNRRDFLEDVQIEVAGRLAQSLAAGRLTVNKEKQPDQVTRVWDTDIKIRDQQRTPLGSDIGIVHVFDEDSTAGKLLILGAPGSGKTTALLELAQELITRAGGDGAEPMPVLCSLSSWRYDPNGLAPWLVDQLKVKYGVRNDVGNAWLNDRLLVPLLDGLDEVPPEHHEACVQAINDFQQEFRPRHIVVCCRFAEYENIPTKLRLNNAVYFLPLADHQIRRYLLDSDSPGLWEVIRGDQVTMELARSPLMLHILTLAHEDTSPDHWQRLRSTSERQAHLFDVYVRRVLSGGVTAHPFSKTQTVHWLAWLAKTMKEHSKSELLIEHMQPSWLQSASQRLVYQLGVLVNGAAIFVLGVWLLFWLSNWFPKGEVSLEYAKVTPTQLDEWLTLMAMGLAAGLVMAIRKRIQPVETLVWSGTKAWRGMTSGMRKTSVMGLNLFSYLGLAAGLLMGVATLAGLWAGNPVGSEIALFNLIGYIGAAIAVVSFTVVILVGLRPGVWLASRTNTEVRGSAADAVVGGLALCMGATPNMGPLLGVVAGGALALLLRFSGGSNLLSARRFSDALVVGLISGFGSGLMSWSLTKGPTGFTDAVAVFMLGGVGIAATVALFAGVASEFKNRRAGVPHLAGGRVRNLTRSLVTGAIIAAICAVMVGVTRYTGNLPLLRATLIIAAPIGGGWVSSLTYGLVVATFAGLFGMVMGAFLGALFGVLNGLTGPDVERRTVPNQGIWQSAANVGVFALAGVVTVGIPYGLMNLMMGAVWTRVTPGPLDWLHLAIAPAILFGVIGGLVPGAACIQHFTLRVVLWCFGMSPFRYAAFLNHATERMILQRVGGRYRFIHDLLREHFAAMDPASGFSRRA